MTKQKRIGTRRPTEPTLPPDSYLDGDPPPDAIDYRALCRKIISDPRSSAMDRLRAADTLRSLEGDSGSPLRDELTHLSDDQLEEQLRHHLGGLVEQAVEARVEQRLAVEVGQRVEDRLAEIAASRMPSTPTTDVLPLPALREPVSTPQETPPDDLQAEPTLEEQLGMRVGWQLERGWTD